MHWTERVIRVLNAKTEDLKELARIAEVDPTYLYTFQSLAGCNLRGQDLRGLYLEGCSLEQAQIDEATKLDPEWDFRIPTAGGEYIYFKISQQLNTMIIHYMDETSYKYMAWAQRELLSRGLKILNLGRLDYYCGVISENKHLQRVLDDKSVIPVRILLRSNVIDDIGRHLPDQQDERFLSKLMLIGLISRKIRHGSKRNYSHLSANAFYPPKLVKVEGTLTAVDDDDDDLAGGSTQHD